WRDRPPPGLGPMVQRHHPDRSLRRCSHGRRRFRSARRADQFRDRAGAGRGRVARRGRQSGGSHRLATQGQSAAAGRRDQHPPPGHPGQHHDPCGQPRARPGASLRAGRRQSRDLAAVLPKAKLAAVLAMDEVVMGVRDAAIRVGATGSLAADGQANVKMAYAAEGVPNPYAGFETRLAPENITLLPKTAAQTTGGNPWSERTVTLKKGESVGTVLRDLGTRPEDIKDVTSALGPRGRDGGLKEGQKLRILLDPSDPKRLRPLRIVVASDSGVDAIVALSDYTDKYVP